ncbi:hypothetical protein BX616_003818 [Lobosporangium transversale]|nr:hypothetical protein BX616_003818 [Lobosporangium transversale]
MGAAMEVEPRTSMERHLMDRDREGQLYLEARRQQAAQDLLGNRSSFLSTITPPSSNPSSVASSLFHETFSSSQEGVTIHFNSTSTSLPATPTSPITPVTTNMSSSDPTPVSLPLPNNNNNNNNNNLTPTGTTTTTTTTTSSSLSPFRSLGPSLQNIVPIIKKTRQRAATAQERSLTTLPPSTSTSNTATGTVETMDRPLVTISPSSLEYQLTANLLKYPTPPSLPQQPTSTRRHRSGSRPRSKSRPRKSRRGTDIGDTFDTHQDNDNPPSTSQSTGHHRQRAERSNSGRRKRRDFEGRKRAHTTPTSISTAAESNQVPPLPQQTSLPSLPPIPPKSPRTLIATYFPGSLPPPPSRGRVPLKNKEPLVVAPTPFKTPTFGPALSMINNSSCARDGPPVPSPSTSLQYIPSTDISRCSTAQPQQNNNEDSDLAPPSTQPSPCTSALGLSSSASTSHNNTSDNNGNNNTTHSNNNKRRAQPLGTHRLPSDVDLLVVKKSSRTGRSFHNHPYNHNHNLNIRNQHIPINNFSLLSHHCTFNNQHHAEESQPLSTSGSTSPTSPTSESFINTSSVLSGTAASAGAGVGVHEGRRSSSGTIFTSTTTVVPPSTTPIYPRGLMPSSSSPLADSHLPLVIRVQQRATPYIRELFPGEIHPNTPSSTHTSQDLEIVLEEITGRIRTNRTSVDPWPYQVRYNNGGNSDSTSPTTTGLRDQKPLPRTHREKEPRYWVFRDHDGAIVLGPIFFLLGHLLPFMWWIGSAYPSIEHPDEKRSAAELAREAEMEADMEARVRARARAEAEAVAAAARSTTISIEGTGAGVGPGRRNDGDLEAGLGLRGMADDDSDTETDVGDLRDHPVIQWLQKQLRTVGATIASIKTSVSTNPNNKDSTIATLQIVRISEDGSNVSDDYLRPRYHQHQHQHQHQHPLHSLDLTNVSTIHVPIPSPTAVAAAAAQSRARSMGQDRLFETRGPWSIAGAIEEEDMGCSAMMLAQRLEYDRKVLRYELDLRWRRINLIWSIGSFVLAIAITAFIVGFSL